MGGGGEPCLKKVVSFICACQKSCLSKSCQGQRGDISQGIYPYCSGMSVARTSILTGTGSTENTT